MVDTTRLSETDGTWDKFKDDWTSQCAKYKEDFEDYSVGAFSVLRELIRTPEKKAAVFAFKENEDDNFVSVCQVNIAGLPRYDSPVMRVRHMILSPHFDFGNITLDEYARALVATLMGAITLSYLDDNFKCEFINFHLRSPNDRGFFATLGRGMNEMSEFQSVQTTGSWLYIKKS